MPIKKVKKVPWKVRKQKILADIKYYETRIEELRSSQRSNFYLTDEDSSDSDGVPLVDHGPSVHKLKETESKLKTCLHATEELTSLQVLQSEVNILVEDPVIDGEAPITEPGIWREVTAECRIDFLPFSITFFTHKPDRQFGPTSYRGLQVSLLKTSHAAELRRSVLEALSRPSDAVQLLRSYATAYRSRRSSLARLAEKYSSSLHMEPLVEDGGFLLKCANCLEVSWRLENKWSPIAPFHHRMKFDLDYMDEQYIKIIAHAHKQLSDPTIDTDERTLILSKIISTCLEAKAQEPLETTESETDDKTIDNHRPNTTNVNKKRTTLDHVPDVPSMKHREVMAPSKSVPLMAPPKSVPVKVKPKSSENSKQKAVKRSTNEDQGDAKRPKLKENNVKISELVDRKLSKMKESVVENNIDNTTKLIADQPKNVVTENSLPKQKTIDKKTVKSNRVDKVNKDPSNKKDEVMKASDKKQTKENAPSDLVVDKPSNKMTNVKSIASSKANVITAKPKKSDTVKNNASPKPSTSGKSVEEHPKNKKVHINTDEKELETVQKTIEKNKQKIKEKSAKVQNVANEKITVKNTKPTNADRQRNSDNIRNDKNIPSSGNSKVKAVDTKSNKASIAIEKKQVKSSNPKNEALMSQKVKTANVMIGSAKSKLPLRDPNKLKAAAMVNKVKSMGNTMKISSTVKEGKENESAQKIAKIQNKRLSKISENTFKKNPLRISPRKIALKFKSPQTEINTNKINIKTIQRLSTNIPRLMKKTVPKT